MKKNDNLEIITRLLELARNPLEYSVFPKEYKQEYVFLANVINDSISRLEHEFDEAFKYAVGRYKSSLKEDKGYGWFHSPEKLIWINTQLNQLRYAVYGERHVRELKWNEHLGDMAYRDLLDQIDRTVFMTPDELKEFNEKINQMALEVLNEILEEEKTK